MKNILLTIGFFLITLNLFSQWNYETVNNGFDDPYRIAYTNEVDGAFLKLENYNEQVIFYIEGSYTCDDYPIVEIICVVNGENKKYTFYSETSDNRECVFITFDLENSGLLSDFKNCTTMKIRINETYCDTETYSFNMYKSSSAYTFINNK